MHSFSWDDGVLFPGMSFFFSSERKLLQLKGKKIGWIFYLSLLQDNIYFPTIYMKTLMHQSTNRTASHHHKNTAMHTNLHKGCYSLCFGWGFRCNVQISKSHNVLFACKPSTLCCSFVIQSARSNLTYLSSNPGRFPPRHRQPPPPSSVNQSR